MRHLLLALMLAATAAFVVGVTIERNDENHHHPAAVEAAEHTDEHATGEEGTPERETDEHAEGGGHTEAQEASEEPRPLGIDIEATPFVVLTAAVTVLLAFTAWLRPSPALLAVIAVAMLAFAVLDVNEVFYQLDEDREGLALLAALVAVVHVASAAVAGLLARRRGESAGTAGTMPA